MVEKPNACTSYALMQPTFMPWIGFFALMDLVDTFVVYDTAQFSRQSWHHRNKIKTANGELLITLPVSHGSHELSICSANIAMEKRLGKILPTIAQSYSKAPFFKVYFDMFSSVFNESLGSGKLLDINLAIIDFFRQVLDIRTKIIFASELDLMGVRGEYVANVGKAINSSYYISPRGAYGYLCQDIAHFINLNLEVRYVDYNHPVYRQINGNFISHCSILDLLFNEGAGAMEIIRSGVRIKAHNQLAEELEIRTSKKSIG